MYRHYNSLGIFRHINFPLRPVRNNTYKKDTLVDPRKYIGNRIGFTYGPQHRIIKKNS